MFRLIKEFENGSKIGYDNGRFDKWCVYIIDKDGKKTPPRDVDYLNSLHELGNEYGNGRVYGDFELIYDRTEKSIDENVLELITNIASRYNNSIEVDILFTTLYMAMVSEECKANTKLGKRIKRLAVCQVLNEEISINEAANCTRGLTAKEIQEMCTVRDF